MTKRPSTAWVVLSGVCTVFFLSMSARDVANRDWLWLCLDGFLTLFWAGPIWERLARKPEVKE